MGALPVLGARLAAAAALLGRSRRALLRGTTGGAGPAALLAGDEPEHATDDHEDGANGCGHESFLSAGRWTVTVRADAPSVQGEALLALSLVRGLLPVALLRLVPPARLLLTTLRSPLLSLGDAHRTAGHAEGGVAGHGVLLSPGVVDSTV